MSEKEAELVGIRITFRDLSRTSEVVVKCSSIESVIRLSPFFRRICESQADENEICLVEVDVFEAARYFIELYQESNGSTSRKGAPFAHEHWNSTRAILAAKWEVSDHTNQYADIGRRCVQKIVDSNRDDFFSVVLDGANCSKCNINGTYCMVKGKDADEVTYRKHDDHDTWLVLVQDGTTSEFWIQESKLIGKRVGVAYTSSLRGLIDDAVDSSNWMVKVDEGWEHQECTIRRSISSVDVYFFWEVIDAVFKHPQLGCGPIKRVEDLMPVLVSHCWLEVPTKMRAHFSAEDVWSLVDILRKRECDREDPC